MTRSPFVRRLFGFGPIDEGLRLAGVVEAWLALALAVLVLHQNPIIPVQSSHMRHYTWPTSECPYAFFVLLEALAMGFAVGGIRFARGISRGIGLLSAVLSAVMLFEFCRAWVRICLIW